MEKANEEKLPFIISKLPWTYDTETSVIVSTTNCLNPFRFSRELEEFERLCDEELLRIKIFEVSWIEGKGMVLNFKPNFESHSPEYGHFTKIIEGIKNGKIVNRELIKKVGLKGGKVKIVLKRTINEEYKSAIEELIKLYIIGKGIYEELLHADGNAEETVALVEKLTNFRTNLEREQVRFHKQVIAEALKKKHY